MTTRGVVEFAAAAVAAHRLRSLLTTLGIIFNRVNVVLFAMVLKGPMPQISPETYAPTVVEWGLSIGLIALTIFLFGLAARLMPVLPKDQTPHSAGAS